MSRVYAGIFKFYLNYIFKDPFHSHCKLNIEKNLSQGRLDNIQIFSEIKVANLQKNPNI